MKQFMNQTFSQKKKDFDLKFFNMSGFGLRVYRPGRYRKQNFSNIQISEKNWIRKNHILSSIFEKQDFVEKFICENNRFDSVCSTESHRSFTFRAYFKNQDSEANLFIGNPCLKWSSSEKKRIRIWGKVFPRNWDFELRFF